MSRYVPVNLRHKHRAEPGKETQQNIAILGLRIAAILCWCASFFGFWIVVRDLLQIRQASAGRPIVELIAFALIAIGALIVGGRLWLLRRWACATAIVAIWLYCLLDPWRPDRYYGQVVDVGVAIGSSLAACIIFAVPLTLAWYISRSKLRSGF